jgi:hypothetical protein
MQTAMKRGRFPGGLVGFVACIAMVETALASGHFSASYLSAAWSHARAMTSSAEVRRAEILCFGDSQIKEGVLATILAQRLGRPAYNLAVHGGQPPAAYFLLRRAIEAGARPRAIVLGCYPGLLAVDASFNVRQWPEILDAGECLDLAWTSSDPKLVAPTITGRALASYRGRESIRETFASVLLGTPRPIVEAVQVHRRNWEKNLGSQAMPRSQGFDDGNSPAPVGRVTWRPGSANRKFLRRILDLARDRGICVYWLMPTLSPAQQAARERQGLDGDYEAFVRNLQGEFPELVVLDARRAGWDRSVFHDTCHLDLHGAAALTEAIADAMLAGPAPTRWVALTPRHFGPKTDDIEDVAASRIAVGLTAGRAVR